MHREAVAMVKVHMAVRTSVRTAVQEQAIVLVLEVLNPNLKVVRLHKKTIPLLLLLHRRRPFVKQIYVLYPAMLVGC